MKSQNYKKAEDLSKRIMEVSNAINRLQNESVLAVKVTISEYDGIFNNDLKFACQGHIKSMVIQTLKNHFISELNDLQKEFAAL